MTHGSTQADIQARTRFGYRRHVDQDRDGAGIAMHSGNLPGYPASHGCIRMPYDFSQLLFSATSKGGTVVVGDGNTPVPYLASNPGLMLTPKDMSPEMLRPLARNDYTWNPESSSSGPITMVVSAADRALYVYRNGNPIGRASVEIEGRGSLGDHVFSLLEGTTGQQSTLAAGRAARRWTITMRFMLLELTSRGFCPGDNLNSMLLSETSRCGAGLPPAVRPASRPPPANAGEGARATRNLRATRPLGPRWFDIPRGDRATDCLRALLRLRPQR